MRNYAAYGRLERAIAAADAGTIRQRWEYGRRLLCDPAATTDAGNLRHGVIGGLLDAAAKTNRKLSEREIRYRLEAGRAYPCESQIRHARADFGTWSALREAGFPARDADPGDEPFDPRGAAEKARAADKQLAFGDPEDPGQLVLFEWFPDREFDVLATIAELRKYATEMAEWTTRQARRDADRLAYLDRLSAAVGGDESTTWEDAQAALDRDGAGEACDP